MDACLASLDDAGDPIVHPDALELFLRQELRTDAAGALARLRAHLRHQTSDGSGAVHLP